MAVWVAYEGLDCQKCNDDQRKDHGFDGKPQIIWEWDGERLDRCPGQLVTHQSHEYIEAYTMLESRFGWPDASGWVYNPYKLKQAIQVIHLEFLRLKEEAQRRHG